MAGPFGFELHPRVPGSPTAEDPPGNGAGRHQ